MTLAILGCILVGLLWIDDSKAAPCKWGGCNGHYVNHVCNRCGHDRRQLGGK